MVLSIVQQILAPLCPCPRFPLLFLHTTLFSLFFFFPCCFLVVFPCGVVPLCGVVPAPLWGVVPAPLCGVLLLFPCALCCFLVVCVVLFPCGVCFCPVFFPVFSCVFPCFDYFFVFLHLFFFCSLFFSVLDFFSVFVFFFVFLSLSYSLYRFIFYVLFPFIVPFPGSKSDFLFWGLNFLTISLNIFLKNNFGSHLGGGKPSKLFSPFGFFSVFFLHFVRLLRSPLSSSQDPFEAPGERLLELLAKSF